MSFKFFEFVDFFSYLLNRQRYKKKGVQRSEGKVTNEKGGL